MEQFSDIFLSPLQIIEPLKLEKLHTPHVKRGHGNLGCY
jgi:hypothetical protein